MTIYISKTWKVRAKNQLFWPQKVFVLGQKSKFEKSDIFFIYLNSSDMLVMLKGHLKRPTGLKPGFCSQKQPFLYGPALNTQIEKSRKTFWYLYSLTYIPQTSCCRSVIPCTTYSTAARRKICPHWRRSPYPYPFTDYWCLSWSKSPVHSKQKFLWTLM